MTDTDLIVPIRVHALAINRHVYTTNGFRRWQPDINEMLSNLQSAEPYRPYSLPWWEWSGSADPSGNPPYNKLGGVHVQWELPEALTQGVTDPDTGLSNFPLVPNRWLVVRYSDRTQNRQAKGWVVHSDYLESEPVTGPGGSAIWAMNLYVTPDTNPPEMDYIGRIHDLSTGPWREPPARPGFLTALSPGTPGFAFFDPYHYGVFSVRDDLADLGGGDFPTDLHSLSYQVLGWYSDDSFDLLSRARDGQIPGLLPPGADTPAGTLADILAALGWKPPADPDGDPALPDTVLRTVYCGRAFKVDWTQAQIPDPDKPDADRVKVILGQSTGEMIGALVRHQTGDERTAELMQALVQGTVENLDQPVGSYTLNQQTHSSWFGGPDSGRIWSIEPRPGFDQYTEPEPADLRWLEQLNRDQNAYEDTVSVLSHTQERAWTLTWLRALPNGYNDDEKATARIMLELTHLLGRAGTVEWLDSLSADLAPPHPAETVGELIRFRNSAWIAAMSPQQRRQLMQAARAVVYRERVAPFVAKPADWNDAEAAAELERLAADIERQRQQAAALLDRIPHIPPGEDPASDEALDAAADRFAAEHGLPPSLQLARAPRAAFYGRATRSCCWKEQATTSR
jgi:hypothetical protein